MQEIDLEPGEWGRGAEKPEPKRRWNFPNQHDWVRREYPNGATPMDGFKTLIAPVAIAVGLFLSNYGWPF